MKHIPKTLQEEEELYDLNDLMLDLMTVKWSSVEKDKKTGEEREIVNYAVSPALLNDEDSGHSEYKAS